MAGVPAFIVRLDGAQLARIDDPAGITVACIQGRLWITQYGDLRDHILEAGMAMRFPQSGAVLVNGLNSGACRIVDPGSRRWHIEYDGCCVKLA